MWSNSKVASSKKIAIVFAIVVCAVLILDRVTKIWAESALTGAEMDFLPGIVGFRLVYNRGASFGILDGATILFVIICAIICTAIIVYLIRYKSHSIIETVALGLLFAGALGNAIDRVACGCVTDFINLEFIDFAVFNVADCGITIGVILWIVVMIFHPLSPFNSKIEKQEN